MNVAAVSVARNEEKMIGQTLRSLLAQTIPVNVVLLDDGSTDETRARARNESRRQGHDELADRIDDLIRNSRFNHD